LDKEIIYIAGAGRSGSTLVDIALGNIDEHWSLGELIFFVENGLMSDEYCSCGKKVRQCEFWSRIIKEWQPTRNLTDAEFVKVQKDLLRNKRLIINFINSFAYRNEQLLFFQDLKTLYELVFKETGARVVIDSSKNAQYIKLLKKLPFKLTVLQVTRSFSGVLNSLKKELVENREEGVEKGLVPQSFAYTLAIWLLDNFFSWFFAWGVNYKRIKYENFVNNPNETFGKILKISKKNAVTLRNRGPLKANHLVAGNRLRISETIFINKSSEVIWGTNVKKRHKNAARLIDFFY
jgi:hypothetical protein